MITPSEEKRLHDEATMRELQNLRVFVVGGGFQYIKMFYDAGFRGARAVQDADIICFTGGEDVHPSLYGEKPIVGTYSNIERDNEEAYLYGCALALKKPMVGICRGAQFLNVMNDGKLWQDVNGHALGGGHAVTDIRTGEVLQNMTSTHHQQMIAGPKVEIIAVAEISTKKEAEKHKITKNKPDPDDMEVLWYPDSLSLAFQPHPEFQHGDCRNYFLDLVDNYVMPAC